MGFRRPAMDNEVDLTVEDLEAISGMLEKANESAGTVSGVFRFMTAGETDAVVSVSYDDERGEHVATVNVFQVYDE
jgi:hypothetical protein